MKIEIKNHIYPTNCVTMDWYKYPERFAKIKIAEGENEKTTGNGYNDDIEIDIQGKWTLYQIARNNQHIGYVVE